MISEAELATGIFPSDLVDRVAWVIGSYSKGENDCPGHPKACKEEGLCGCRITAREILVVMREPTERMRDLGAIVGGFGILDDRASARSAWQAMIDAALKE